MKEQIKAPEKIQLSNEEKETRTEIKDLKQKEEINIQLEQNEETRIQNNEEMLRTSGTTLNIPTSES